MKICKEIKSQYVSIKNNMSKSLKLYLYFNVLNVVKSVLFYERMTGFTKKNQHNFDNNYIFTFRNID